MERVQDLTVQRLGEVAAVSPWGQVTPGLAGGVSSLCHLPEHTVTSVERSKRENTAQKKMEWSH